MGSAGGTRPPLPFYLEQGAECALFETAHANRLPLLLKGPTGCGKTRFVAHMAARLGRRFLLIDENPDAIAVMRERLAPGTVFAPGLDPEPGDRRA